ncbi:serine/threonine-protein kinase [[Phormidium] sp. ETS-05]|uniref:serine/threonine-protein kinase n=1 Tax=[Phormidium] sp. ETS-05 TaxID=222819 RepID=UPI0018EF32FA|nr:serine/threonine-protein kinase [[Phormidium] sp. ETS-05]
MSYCLNPNCLNPENPDGKLVCINCGSKIMLKDRYRPIKLIGVGGMGRNFLASDEDTPSKRLCVIKQLSPAPSTQTNPNSFHKAVELFNREAVQLDRLGSAQSHIPQLLAYLEQDKRLYFVQEFINGDNLLVEMEQEGVFDEAKIRQLLLDLLPVIKYIHQQGVIHRDLKPTNMMRRRTTPGENRGELVLIDFGISKQLSGTIAAEGTVLGTPGYAPPEQMTYGEAYPASDIYALGTTCIHLLTGVHPARLYNPQQNRWLWQDLLQQRGSAIGSDLEKILDKCLAPDVRARYQSAEALLADIQPAPVSRLPVPPLPPFPRGSAPVPPSPSPPIARTTAPSTTVPTYRPLHSFQAHTGTVRALAINPDGKLLATGSDDNTIKLWEIDSGKQLLTLASHSNWVTSLAFHPDGKRLVSGSYDTTIKLWQLPDGQLIRTLTAHTREVFCVAFSPDGTRMASGSYQNVNLWNLRDGFMHLLMGDTFRTLSGHIKWVNAVAFSPDGKVLASGGGDNMIKLWDVAKGEELRKLQGHRAGVLSLNFSPDGAVLASGSYDKTVKLWRRVDGLEIRTLEGYAAGVVAVNFGRDGQTVTTGTENGTLQRWHLREQRPLDTVTTDVPLLDAVAFSSQGKTIATGAEDGTVKIWQCD